MEDGNTEKYNPSRVIQDFVFLNRKRGCIKCISLQVYNNTSYCLMQVKSIAECSKGSILQYFRPSLSYHLLLRSLFCLF